MGNFWTTSTGSETKWTASSLEGRNKERIRAQQREKVEAIVAAEKKQKSLFSSLFIRPRRDLQLVQWEGISVNWLLDRLLQEEFFKDGKCSLGTLRHVGIAEYILGGNLEQASGSLLANLRKAQAYGAVDEESGYEVFGKATAILLYCDTCTLEQLVNALGKHRGEYVWVDIFCVDPFAWTGLKTPSGIKNYSRKLLTELPKRVREVNNTWLLLDWCSVGLLLKQPYVALMTKYTMQCDGNISILGLEFDFDAAFRFGLMESNLRRLISALNEEKHPVTENIKIDGEVDFTDCIVDVANRQNRSLLNSYSDNATEMLRDVIHSEFCFRGIEKARDLFIKSRDSGFPLHRAYFYGLSDFLSKTGMKAEAGALLQEDDELLFGCNRREKLKRAARTNNWLSSDELRPLAQGIDFSGKSEFQLWMERNGVPTKQPDGNIFYKTSLQQETELAILLYEEAEGIIENNDGLPTDVRATAVIETFQRDTESIEVDSLVHWCGISVDWFVDSFCGGKFMQRLASFGCELWFVRKVAIIEMLRRWSVSSGAFIVHLGKFNEPKVGGRRQKQIVKEATTFLSYTGRHKLSSFLETLSQLRGEWIWMDIFCVDQFAWTYKSRHPDMAPFRSQLIDGLHGRIKEIRKTALLLESFESVMATLSQTWVLWEVYGTVKVQAEFRIILRDDDKSKFLESLHDESSQDVLSLLSNIDCRATTAADDKDRQLILKKMDKTGLYKVSCAASSLVQNWLGNIAHTHGIGMLNSKGVFTNTRLSRILAIAHILFDQGKAKLADALAKKVVAAQRRNFGEDHINTVRAKTICARGLYYQAKYREFLEMSRLVFHCLKRDLGCQNRETLKAMAMLQTALDCTDQTEEAVTFGLHTLEVCRCFIGDDDALTVEVMRNLAISLEKDKDCVSDAPEVLLYEVYCRQRQIFGQNHSATLDTMKIIGSNGSGSVLTQLNFRLLRITCFEEHRRVHGPDHIKTIESLEALVIFGGCSEVDLGDEVENDEAKLLEYCTWKRCMFAGNEHPETIEAQSRLANVWEKRYGPNLVKAGEALREAASASRRLYGSNHPLHLYHKKNLDAFYKRTHLFDRNPKLCGCLCYIPSRLVYCCLSPFCDLFCHGAPCPTLKERCPKLFYCILIPCAVYMTCTILLLSPFIILQQFLEFLSLKRKDSR